MTTTKPATSRRDALGLSAADAAREAVLTQVDTGDGVQGASDPALPPIGRCLANRRNLGK